MLWLAKIRALLIIIIENIFTCYILAVVPIGYDPLLDQAGMTANRNYLHTASFFIINVLSVVIDFVFNFIISFYHMWKFYLFIFYF